jgi:hypothetical protein
MKYTFIILIISLTIFSSCNSQTTEESKIGSYDTIKNQLKETEYVKTTPVANIDELEMEVNNGGFNQYFINSYGRNCFETLRLLKKTGKNKTAKLLEEAITLINPRNLKEEEFLEKLRKHQIDELYSDKISEKLNILDEKFYKYPDGSLK